MLVPHRGWNGTDHGPMFTSAAQPLFLYWSGRRKLRRVGINQPQADRFLAPALELVLSSIEVLTLAYGTGGAGARNDRESVTGAAEPGRNSLAVKLP